MSTLHFTDAELACHCGCGALPPTQFQAALEEFRLYYGAPMRLSSGARCPVHNASVSHTGPHGPHTIAAVDVLCHGRDARALLDAAIRWGWSGIGVHQRGPSAARFLHLDDLPDGAHPRPWVWTY